jgi:ribosome biogenesis GTPase A
MQLINWYPGHIAKAQRQLKDNSKLVDLIIEMVDSRLPISSHFSFIEEQIKHKEKIILLNKKDLAEIQETNNAVNYWKSKGVTAIPFDTVNNKDIVILKNVLGQYHKKLSQKLSKKGIRPRSIRVMIVGLPNIGKSTLINRLVGKKSTKVQNKPGVTRNTQWVKIADNIDLLDTPGIIIPKFEDQTLALKLVIIGSIPVQSFEPVQTSIEIINLINKVKPRFLNNIVEDFSLENFGKFRNFLKSGAQIDINRSANVFLSELRDGKLGRLSLE